MIIIWYTDPSEGAFTSNPGKFSSYYQYNTETTEFVRIRLELGRSVHGSDKGDTFVNYKAKRAVGFSKEVISTRGDWSVNRAGELCHHGAALSQAPEEGARTYDTSDPSQPVHRGNPVIIKPNLPEGIGAVHLNLLANEALISKTSILLSASSASPAALAEALKAQVSEVMGKSFADITDADILTKLKEQLVSIGEASSGNANKAVEACVEEAESLASAIDNKMGNGELIPTEDFSRQLNAFKESVVQVKDTLSTGKEMRPVVDSFKATHDALANAINTLSEQQRSSFQDAVAKSAEALATAVENTTRFEAFERKTAEIEKTESIEEYEKEMMPREAEAR